MIDVENKFRQDFNQYPIAIAVQDKIFKWIQENFSPKESQWYYESDGDEHSRTHYLVRHNDPEFIRIDFQSKREALRVLHTLNGGKQ